MGLNENKIIYQAEDYSNTAESRPAKRRKRNSRSSEDESEEEDALYGGRSSSVFKLYSNHFHEN